MRSALGHAADIIRRCVACCAALPALDAVDCMWTLCRHPTREGGREIEAGCARVAVPVALAASYGVIRLVRVARSQRELR